MRTSKAAQQIGVEEAWCKCDHLNQSGSFKDRSAAVGVAWARPRLSRGDLRLEWERGGRGCNLRRTRWIGRLCGSLLRRSEVETEPGHGTRGPCVQRRGGFCRAFAAAREAAAQVG